MIYRVAQVTSQNTWDGSHGPMVSYKMEVTDDGGNQQTVELNQKPDTPAPSVGQEIDGFLEPAKREGFPPKLKKTPKPAGGGFGGGKGKPRDPAERASIERQTALRGACDVAAALPHCGIGDADTLILTIQRVFAANMECLAGPPVEAQATRNVQSVFPGTTELPAKHGKSDPNTDARRNNPVSPSEHALTELKEHLKTWVAADPQAQEKYQLKLSALGLKSAKEADDPQLEELLSFVKGRAAKGASDVG